MDHNLRSEYYEKAYNLHSNGQIPEAEELYGKILAAYPDDCEVLNLMGICKLARGDYENAEYYVKRAVELRPLRYFYETLGRVYFEEGKFDLELETRLKIEELFGFDYETAFSLGLVYKNLGDYEKAEQYYQKAAKLNSKARDTHFNLANLYTWQQKYDKVQEELLQCIKINPEDTEAKYFLSLNCMRQKDYKSGLPLFEARLCRQTAMKTSQHTYPNLFRRAKLWKGEDISNKTLFTYYEAGFGDMIMFSRYIPMVLERCSKLIIKPQIELCGLFRENFPQAEIMDYFYDEKSFNFDYHIPFLSIPYTLGLDEDNMFISRKRYLKANYERTMEYYKEFFDNDCLKIGIKWQGNTYYETDRVINVDAFAPLFEQEKAIVYSLQTYDGHEEFEKLASRYKITDLSRTFRDFSDTAAAVENLDLIICNDTSLAHLAGAMGKRCCVLLPHNYNWRWHTDLSHCSWYSSVQLFSARENESWNDLMKRVIVDMNKRPVEGLI